MIMYKDDILTDVIDKGSEIPVKQPIYIRIHFTGPPNLNMYVTSCVATPTDVADPLSSAYQWWLITDG